AAVRGGAGAVGREALHVHLAAHHVLGHAGAGAALDDDLGELVHAGRVVAGVAGDRHLDRRVHADRDGVGPVRVDHRDVPAGQLVGVPVQVLVERADTALAQVERQAFHTYISSGAGSKTVACLTPGRCASERNSDAIAT